MIHPCTRKYLECYIVGAETWLWNILAKITPEKYAHDRQSVSEEYEMPLWPLHCYNHSDSVRVNIEANQLAVGANLWEGPNGE